MTDDELLLRLHQIRTQVLAIPQDALTRFIQAKQQQPFAQPSTGTLEELRSRLQTIHQERCLAEDMLTFRRRLATLGTGEGT